MDEYVFGTNVKGYGCEIPTIDNGYRSYWCSNSYSQAEAPYHCPDFEVRYCCSETESVDEIKDSCNYDSVKFTPYSNNNDVANDVASIKLLDFIDSNPNNETSSFWNCKRPMGSLKDIGACLEVSLDSSKFLLKNNSVKINIDFECVDEEFCSLHLISYKNGVYNGIFYRVDDYHNYDNYDCTVRGGSEILNISLTESVEAYLFGTGDYLNDPVSFGEMYVMYFLYLNADPILRYDNQKCLTESTTSLNNQVIGTHSVEYIYKSDGDISIRADSWGIGSDITLDNAFDTNDMENDFKFFIGVPWLQSTTSGGIFTPYDYSTIRIKSVTVEYVPRDTGNNNLDNRLCVALHTCTDWPNDIRLELTNTLHMVVSDINSYSSDYIIINNEEQLPSPRWWSRYIIYDYNNNNNNNVSKIESFEFGMTSNALDYCFDNLYISQYINSSVNSIEYEFEDIVNPGIILSQQCQFSFFYLANDELIYCNEGFFKLYTNYAQLYYTNMYNIEIDTCSASGAEIEFDSLKNDFRLSIIGKNTISNVWEQSSLYNLDHVALNGNVNWNQVGSLIAANVKIYYNGSKTEIASNQAGSLIGFKIIVASDDPHFGDGDFYKFDEWQLYFDIGQKFEMYVTNVDAETQVNHTWIATRSRGGSTIYDADFDIQLDQVLSFYFEEGKTSNPSDYMYNYVLDNEYALVHIYGIFEQDIDSYSLPYIFVDNNLSWSSAEEYCLENYGTHLASIHSKDEETALNLVRKGRTTWIGYNDRNKEGTFEWSDYSGVNYEGDYNYTAPDCVSVKFEENYNSVFTVYGWKYISVFEKSDSKWLITECDERDIQFVCSSGTWSRNDVRSFNIPISSGFDNDNVVMAVFSNSNDEDATCLSRVAINDKISKTIDPNWIGNPDSDTGDCNKYKHNNCDSNGYAMFRWPVCNIQVEAIFFDWEHADVNTTDTSVAGLSCDNYNRLHSTTCEISQEYTFEKSTTFEMSEEQSYETSSSYSQTQGESSASESSKTFGGSFSQTDGTSFSIGSSVAVSASASASTKVGAAGSSVKVSATIGYEATASIESSSSSESTSESNWEHSSSTLNERYVDVTRENSETNSNTYANSMSVTKTETESISCTASMDVPPLSNVQYTLEFAQAATIVPTYTTLKLTMCDASFENDDNNVIYIYDIYSEVGFDSTSKCDVVFNSPQILINTLTCAQEQKIAYYSESTSIPLCNQTDPNKYDGCQCNGLNFWGDATSCVCVDIGGNVIDGTQILHENDDWRDTCRQLNCSNSIYQSSSSSSTSSSSGSSGSAAATSDDDDDDDSNNSNINSIFNFETIVIIGIILSTLSCCVLSLSVAYGVYVYTKNGNKYNEERMSDINTRLTHKNIINRDDDSNNSESDNDKNFQIELQNTSGGALSNHDAIKISAKETNAQSVNLDVLVSNDHEYKSINNNDHDPTV